MDALLNLGRDSEYTTVHAPLLREVKKQYYFVHAVYQELCDTKPGAPAIRTNIHLPKISLPTFDGDIFQWVTFRDKFVALIDSDSSLAPIEKFHYLVGCVNGRAAAVVNSLKMTGDNYPIVWKKLNEQFDNPRLSAKKLVDNILNFRKMDSESVPGLMEFLHVFDECLRLLEGYNMEDLTGFILFVLANRNLSQVTRELFERENTMDFPTVEELVNFVKGRVKVLENVGPPSIKTFQKGKLFPMTSKKATVLVTAHERLKIKCPLCKNNHDLKTCNKFLKMPAPKRQFFQ